MIISNTVLNEDGSYDFDFHVDNNECAFLVNFAVQEMIRRGLISLSIEEAQQELDLFKENGVAVN